MRPETLSHRGSDRGSSPTDVSATHNIDLKREPLFTPLPLEQAEPATRATLEKLKQRLGFVPNLMATYARVPVVLEAYMQLDAVFARASLTAKERELVKLAASSENHCAYCVAAHATSSVKRLGISKDVAHAVAQGTDVSDRRVDALVRLTREMVSLRGFITKETIDEFLGAGFRKEQVFEVTVGVALKTLSTYIEHLAPQELDSAFQEGGEL